MQMTRQQRRATMREWQKLTPQQQQQKIDRYIEINKPKKSLKYVAISILLLILILCSC